MLIVEIVVLDEVEAKQPNIFGAYGGRSRVFAMSEISFNLGLMLGPLLAGVITENIGFGAMSMTLGKTIDYVLCKTSTDSYISILGTLCLVVAFLTYYFFMSGHQHTENDIAP